MNLKKYHSKVCENPNWITENVEVIPLERVKIVDDGGQVRAGGIQPSHVSELADDIGLYGQYVPITIDENNNVVEGNHRVKAVKLLRRRNPGVDKWKTIRVYRRTFETEAEKRRYQLSSNVHLTSKSSTNQDYALAVEDDLKGGVYSHIGLDWNSYNDAGVNFGKLVGEIADVYNIVKGKCKSIVKIATSGTPNQKFKNFTKTEVVDGFAANNPIGWDGKKPGDISGNHAVYAVGQQCNVYPNLNGNAFKKKTSNDNVSNAAVVWNTNTHGLTGKGLDDYRREVVRSINKMNNSSLLKEESIIIDEVFIASQKLRDSKENPKKFFRVQKLASGDFNDSIPTGGWK